MTTKARIIVTGERLGRLTAWRVFCSKCDLNVWPCRQKVTAVGLASRHAAEAHQGNAVVAVAKI